eukprot:10385534-Ditylum_brightwellii.AAC.1
MTRLPAVVCIDQTSCQFQVSATWHLQINILEVEGNKELCIIDGGSNNSLAGAGMHLYELAEYPECVDIIDASDNVQDGMKSLPISTYCAVVISATSNCCLCLFYNYAGYFEGKSILSANQSLIFGVKSCTEPSVLVESRKL